MAGRGSRSQPSQLEQNLCVCLPQATPNKPRGCTAGAYTCGCMRGGARGKKGAPCAPPLPPWLPPLSSVTSPALCDHGIALIQKNVTLLFCSPYHVLAAGGAAAATELRVDPPREGAPALCDHVVACKHELHATTWHATHACDLIKARHIQDHS